jgi:hypothetical protein
MSIRPLLSLFLAPCLSLSAAEVFEASLGRESELPKGKEADGIRGDFVLRSAEVEALISQNAHNRRANMSTFYGEDGVTPGCLYDLTLRGSNNDQLIVYGPAGHGAVSYVQALPSGNKGEAAVLAVTTAGKNGGVFKSNEYRLRDGENGLHIITTLRNETQQPQKVSLKADFTRFEVTGKFEGIEWVDAINPAHRCGYAVGLIKETGNAKGGDSLELAPGAEVQRHRFFAVGVSPAAAVGEVLKAQGKSLAKLEGQLIDESGKGLGSGRFILRRGKESLVAHADKDGRIALHVAAGSWEIEAADLGRPSVNKAVDLQAGSKNPLIVQLAAASAVVFDISAEDGSSIPCKAHFEPLDPQAQKLDLGPKWRAHGCVDQYHSEKGQFSVALPPGAYRVVVVRGPEYDHLKKEITLKPGEKFNFKGSLKRSVNSKGWISADFHNHSTPSGDNVCDTDGRLINIAVEHLEFTPTTEHNRLYDWEPTIKALGLERFVKTVKGIELTGSRQHFNAFPFEPDALLQDGGAPQWNDDPRITALTLRRWQGERADRYIQFNHPDLSNMFLDRNSDGILDGGFVGVGGMIDASEVQNGPGTGILTDAPFSITRGKGSLAAKASASREFLWKQLLNQGLRITAVGVADAHSVYGNGVGCWRCYIPSQTDEPQEIDWAQLSPRVKAGNMVLSTGPFLEVSTQNGKIAGDDDRCTGSIKLKVRVQCSDWLDIDRVQVLVNSRPEPSLNFTRAKHPAMFGNGVVKFEQTLEVPLQQDAHLIVVALDEDGDEKIGFGTSDYAKMRPCAYNNPIYVDADGGGFKPNGDTLGYALPGAGLSADKARALLQAR